MLLDKDSITGNNQFSKANADEVIDAINSNQTATLQLPTTIYATVGDTLQLFYRSMVIDAEGEYKYHFRISDGNNGGKQFPKYYELTPTVAGTHTLTVNILDRDFVIVGSETSTLEVREAIAEPTAQQNVWCIGASTTASGVWQAEFERRITGVDGTGTPPANGFSNFFLHTEGNPGYAWLDYTTSPSRSPFIFSGIEGDMDFEQYRINEGLDVPTVMYIFLTWNGMTSWRTDAEWDIWDDDVYKFIDEAKLAFPNIRIVLMAQLFPSLIGGLGSDYGARGEYLSDSIYCIRQQKRMALIYDRISNEASYSDFVEHIDCSLQHDAVNNVSNFQKQVNTRNTNTELFGNNGLHPDNNGYHQVSDAVYREFIAKDCQG